MISTLQYIAKKLSANTSVDLTAAGLRLTHSDLAAMIGSTRETISLELHKLKESGFIDYDKSRFVIYLDKLNAD